MNIKILVAFNADDSEESQERSAVHRKRMADGFFLYSLLEIKQRYHISGQILFSSPKGHLRGGGASCVSLLLKFMSAYSYFQIKIVLH